MNGRRDQSGQAILEYILLVAVIVSAFMIVAAGLRQTRVAERLLKPLREDFANTYKYGHPKAKGWDEGGPENHPRADENKFRIFISPRVR